MHHTRPPAFPASILRCAASVNCWLATRRYRRSHHGHYEAEHAQHIVFSFLFFDSLLCRWIVELVIQCPETNFNQWESNKKEEMKIRWFERLNFYGRGTGKKNVFDLSAWKSGSPNGGGSLIGKEIFSRGPDTGGSDEKCSLMTLWEGHFDWRAQFRMARSRQKRVLKLPQEGCSLAASRWVPVRVEGGRFAKLCKEENELVRMRSFCTRVILTSQVISAAIEFFFF